MFRQELESAQPRSLRFETVEERLVLSADPLPTLILHGALVDPAPDELIGYDHHSVNLQDVAAPTQQLATVNAATGVDYVHNNFNFYGAGQTVAVIDSGIAWDHYNLGHGYGANYRVVGGWDFAENDANPYDDAPAGFHGTHVAGIIGSDHATNTGVAPDVDLVALRVFDDAGQGNFAWVESALQWVISHRNSFENPITTVNMSLGVPAMNGASVPNWAMLEDELATLNAMGIFVSVSAGNDFAQFNTQGLSYPAVSQWVVPVASANDFGTALSGFSQRDNRVLVAPGETIVSTVPDALFSFNGVPNDWASASGTSMASPYVAGASVLVREAYWSIGVTNVNQTMIYNALFDTADLIYDPITAASYHFIDVQAAITSILSQYNGGESAQAPTTDLGVVDVQQVADITVAGDTWYRVTAAHSGYFTARATSAGQQNVDVRIYNDAQQLLVDGVNIAGFARADALVTAGQTLYVRITGNSPDTDLLMCNLVGFNGGNVVVHGTAGNDWFGFAAGPQHAVCAGGITYMFDAATVNNFTFAGGAGYDALRFTGTAGDETATIYVEAAKISGAGFQINAPQIERFALYGGGGNDTAKIGGSAGSDVLKIAPGSVEFNGSGFSRSIYGFNDVTVYGGGGFDRAAMYDSSGNDFLWASPTWTQMRGPGFLHTITSFESVTAFASLGSDRASLNDSPGDDVFMGRVGYAELRGPGFELLAHQFDDAIGYANGGYDRAFIYDVLQPYQWISDATFVALRGSNFTIYAARFDQSLAHAVATQSKPTSLGQRLVSPEFMSDGDRSVNAGGNMEDHGAWNDLAPREQARANYFASFSTTAILRRSSMPMRSVQSAPFNSTGFRPDAPSGYFQQQSSAASNSCGVAAPTVAPGEESASATDALEDPLGLDGDSFAAREMSAIDFLYFTLSEGL